MSQLYRNLHNIFKITSNQTKYYFSAHKYHSRHEFLVDIEQILENCVLYNGKESPFTEKAETLVKACKLTLDEVSYVEIDVKILQCLFYFLNCISNYLFCKFSMMNI